MNRVLEKGDRFYRIRGSALDLYVVESVTPRLAIASEKSPTGERYKPYKFSRKLVLSGENWIVKLAEKNTGIAEKFVLANDRLNRQYEPYRVSYILKKEIDRLYWDKSIDVHDGIDRFEALALIQKAKSLLTTPVDQR